MQDRITSREHAADSRQGKENALSIFDCIAAADKGRFPSTSYFLLPAKKKPLSTVYSLLSTGGGLTLVEVMIAFLVLLITSLALMQTALVSISANMQNVLRDEAVSIAEMRFTEAKSAPFDDINQDGATDSNPLTIIKDVPRTLKNVDVTFGTTMTVSQLSTDIKRVDVTVTWTWKGVSYTHSASTIMRRTT
jgi:Tfp pilus assembly protein PilV